MKPAFLILFLCIASVSFSQTAKPKPDKASESAFRKQVMELQTYQDEKAKLPKLRKLNPGVPVKIIIEIEKQEPDADDDATATTLTGYIKEATGPDTTTAYEIHFDKKEQKIVSVKNAGEITNAPQDEGDDDEKAPKSKPHKKKSKDDDGDDE